MIPPCVYLFRHRTNLLLAGLEPATHDPVTACATIQLSYNSQCPAHQNCTGASEALSTTADVTLTGMWSYIFQENLLPSDKAERGPTSLSTLAWWRIGGSNPGPAGYEPAALPTELMRRIGNGACNVCYRALIT